MPKKELYLLARAFQKTRLWDQLYDSQLFAVQMPDGALGYVCVMGMRGEHLALAVYPGSAGLDAYRRLYGSLEGMREIVRRENLMSQDCAMCSFENRDELSERERAEIRDLGLRFQGKKSHPMFKRYKPLRLPWYVEDPRDEAYLRLGLLAGLEVARRVEGRAVQQDLFHAPDSGVSKEALGFSEGPPFDREIPLLTPREDGTFAWGRTPLPDPVKPVYASPRLGDEMLLTKLKKLKQVDAWECGVFMHPEPTAEGETDEDGFVTEPTYAPYFPLVLLMVERVNGLVLHMGMTGEPEADLGELLDAFVKGMMKNGRPEEIFVNDERAFALLEGIAGQLGLRITLLEGLPLLEEAEDEFVRSVDAGEDGAETLDALLDQAQGIELPDAMRAMLENLLEKGSIPDSVAEKARRLLEGMPRLPETAPQALPASRKRAAPMKGSYHISVSLEKGCYRHILISASATLFDLHAAILDAFQFDDDHLHAFFMDNKIWSQAESYYSEHADEADRHTPDYLLGEVGLSVGKQFKYLFDFGDEWRFQCKVLKVTEAAEEEAAVIRSVGEPPLQYGSPEDGENGEDDDDEESLRYPEVNDPRKTARLYARLALPKETVKLLLSYFDAFANLYGVVPLRKALEIYNKQNEPMSETDFMAFVEVARHEEHCYSILGGDDIHTNGKLASPLDREIIHGSLYLVDELENFKSDQGNKPYYIPGKRALLRYADDGYFEKTQELRALRNYFRKEKGIPAGQADDVADELQLHARMGEHDMEYILSDMDRMGVKLKSIAEIVPFCTLYFEMVSHTRMPQNRGHTPVELADRAPSIDWGPGITEAIRREGISIDGMRAQAQRMEFASEASRSNYLSQLDRIEQEIQARSPRSTAPKIARNAPCPCGSGKKYKQCCGKDV